MENKLRKGSFKKAIIVIFIMLFTVACHSADTSHVNRKVNKSRYYTKDEINAAMDVVIDMFDYQDCTLTDLWYDESYFNPSDQGWAKQYEADEAIVLLSNFKIGFNAEACFNRNTMEKEWQWVLVRNNNEEWQCVNWGHG